MDRDAAWLVCDCLCCLCCWGCDWEFVLPWRDRRRREYEAATRQLRAVEKFRDATEGETSAAESCPVCLEDFGRRRPRFWAAATSSVRRVWASGRGRIPRARSAGRPSAAAITARRQRRATRRRSAATTRSSTGCGGSTACTRRRSSGRGATNCSTAATGPAASRARARAAAAAAAAVVVRRRAAPAPPAGGRRRRRRTAGAAARAAGAAGVVGHFPMPLSAALSRPRSSTCHEATHDTSACGRLYPSSRTFMGRPAWTIIIRARVALPLRSSRTSGTIS